VIGCKGGKSQRKSASRVLSCREGGEGTCLPEGEEGNERGTFTKSTPKKKRGVAVPECYQVSKKKDEGEKVGNRKCSQQKAFLMNRP